MIKQFLGDVEDKEILSKTCTKLNQLNTKLKNQKNFLDNISKTLNEVKSEALITIGIDEDEIYMEDDSSTEDEDCKLINFLLLLGFSVLMTLGGGRVSIKKF